MRVEDKEKQVLDAYREKLRNVYCEIPLEGIYLNSRSAMEFAYEGPDGKPRKMYLDPMVSSIVASSIVPGSAVLVRGGHGGGKTSMIQEVAARVFGMQRNEINEAMIRGNDDQNVNTLIASYHIGKLITTGDEEVRWRKFVTCPVKIVDEINRLPPTASNGLFEILNKGEAEFGGQVFRFPEKDYEIFATLNPNDVGTYPMSRPFLDRFGICIPAVQIPGVEDLMALSSRKDDKVYGFKEKKAEENGRPMKESRDVEKVIADKIVMSRDALMYQIYLAEALATCERGDFDDKSHSELSLEERCKGCGYDTSESLCRAMNEGFSGRAFLDLQRWAKGYTFFLDAVKNPDSPEVQQSIVETLVPFSLYHRGTPNPALFTKDPYFGRRLHYLTEVAKKARNAFNLIKQPLAEIPDVLHGKVLPDDAKVHQVKKDLVVQKHFLPVVMASKLPTFRSLYGKIEEAQSMTPEDVKNLERTLSFGAGADIPQRAKAFLRLKAKVKAEGGEHP